MSQLKINLAVSAREAWGATVRAAEAWGAEIEGNEEGGRIQMPVVAGLRRGFVAARLDLQPRIEGSHLTWIEEGSEYRLQLAPIVVLLISGIGGVLTVLWPFYPGLLDVAPFGAVLALGGWFLVLSRLRNSGPAEFLKAVEKEAVAGEPNSGSDPGIDTAD
jgi:uncharacterized membrane protein YgdD (TMEM256/DUF423 family)